MSSRIIQAVAMIANHVKALVIFHSPSSHAALLRSGLCHFFIVPQKKVVYQFVIPAGLLFEKDGPVHAYLASESFDACFFLSKRLIHLSVLQPIRKESPAYCQNKRPYDYSESPGWPVMAQQGCYKIVKRIDQLGRAIGFLNRH